MSGPNSLKIAAGALDRLVREEATYHKELKDQEEKLQRMKDAGSDGDENYEYMIRQLTKAIEETKAVLPNIHKKIIEAEQKASAELKRAYESGEEIPKEDQSKATAAIEAAKELDIWQDAQPN